MISYLGKKIIIIGLGKTGLSCINFFYRQGVKPWLMDEDNSPKFLKQIPSDLPCHLGSLNIAWILKSTLIVISPGVPLSHPSLIAAKKAKIEIIGDIELFAREAQKPIIAITGSNGKSTVTAMLGKIASYAGIPVGMGGNLGTPALNLLNKKDCQLYIIEVSSFQLESTFKLNTLVSSILNVTHDHMDRYPLGINQYRAYKLKIYSYSKINLINLDDPLTWPIDNDNKNCVGFSKNSGTYQIKNIHNDMWLVANKQIVLKCSHMKIRGYHNYMNALSALAIADIVNFPRIAIVKALKNFSGLSHRFQLVLKRNNVIWINDSKSTNVESTKTALMSTNTQGNIHLLLGGDSKSANLLTLSNILKRKKVKLYCFGKDAYLLSKIHTNAEVSCTLKQSIIKIKKNIHSGDVVLLSPACSSLDQFKNFKDRGNRFIQLAKQFG
ncbi:UDP-N-acetylmuramoyl-L-alanine:D-glutamate ligase [Wigglesworthia glossinidia endosymbiont of Glossina morsitans morsitans (Yale colony)]|uniref:UDP-N-acetylmuramoylalanine--D-glutamate ligase n=1 Tax=Wigglesworthia glossinidia endosymbiont of Glossina morsitans morsitans (Yale colony) TaxID=1142511 RepID=H6Q5C6_WIGGL|nr:UDP-N-acetylmuramoyl-L-alanine--D-glutamate ligase [Wigglesworthia glossinidia]AFA41391.1 UDP-N-acetylmuramoyl-L-alanine:D-glutamate ligase [Wigglesworthia glossinidia endosymbiont of Glossina morsitans morsitans (Yale colony)]